MEEPERKRSWYISGMAQRRKLKVHRKVSRARARALRKREQRRSPTQSLAARRRRHYGGVGNYPTVRDLARKYGTGTILSVRYGKTTGDRAAVTSRWRVTSHGLEAVRGRGTWSAFERKTKRKLGTSLAILGVSEVRGSIARISPRRRAAVRRSSKRMPMAVRENPPGPFIVRGGYMEFHDGHRYKVDRTTIHQAAVYLNEVKEAELHGRPIPRGPHGISPGAAAVLVHFGRRKKRRRKACVCPTPRRRHAKKRVAPKRRKRVVKRVVKRKHVAKRRHARRPPRQLTPPRRRPAPRARPEAPSPDVWDYVYDTYGRTR